VGFKQLVGFFLLADFWFIVVVQIHIQGAFFFFFPQFCDIIFFGKYFPKISMLALKPSGDRLAL